MLDAGVDVAEFGAEGGGARHGGVDVKPEVVLATNARDFWDGVDRVGGRGAYGGADEAGNTAGGFIFGDLPG